MSELKLERTERRIKVALLVASLATLVLLAASALRENIFAPWRAVRSEYAAILKQKASDERGKAIAGQFKNEIAQVVLPELDAVDRCITCHAGIDDPRMANEKNPHQAHPGDILLYHPPEKFGCVLCHGGQGRATDTEEAHGEVAFWPTPLIPKPYLYAGCGTCHTHVRAPNRAILDTGRELIEGRGCLACHRLDGRGGDSASGPSTGVQGPDLSQAGSRGFDPNWHASHLKRRNEAQPTNLWTTKFAELSATEQEVLDDYLWSRVGAPELIEAKALFHSLGCRGCHQIGGVGGDDGPDLTREGEKDPHRLDYSHVSGEHNLANWLKEHFRSPAAVVANSQMPELGLTEEQIDKLTLYMFSLRRRELPSTYWPRDRVRAEHLREREFAQDGMTLYTTFCAACHGPQGQGMRYRGMTAFPAIANPDFLAAASDEFLRATITRGRPGRRMPAWGEKKGGLRPEEITTIVDALRAMAQTPAPKEDKPFRWLSPPAPTTRPGAELYAANCAGCHGANGEGGKGGEGAEGLAINNPVFLESASDSYLVTTISQGRRGTTMAGFSQASPTHPALAPEEIESIAWFIRSWQEAK